MDQGGSSAPFTNPQRAPRLLPNPFNATPSAGIRTDGLASSSSKTLTDGPFVTSPLNLRTISSSVVEPSVSSVHPRRTQPSPSPAYTPQTSSTRPQTHHRQTSSQLLAVPHHAATLGPVPPSQSQWHPSTGVKQPQPHRPGEFGQNPARTFTDPFNDAPPRNAGAGPSSTPSTRVPSSTSIAGVNAAAPDYYGEDSEYKGYGYGYTPGYAKLPPASATSEGAFLVKSPSARATNGWPNEEPTYSEQLARLFETRRYERPSYPALAVHTLLCMFAYPVLFLTALAASGKTLFWSRVITGVGCGLVGLSLGVSLVRFARRHLEATTWATVIHESLPPTGTYPRPRADDPSSPVPIQFTTTNSSTSSHTHFSTTIGGHPHPAKRQTTFLPRSPNTPIAPIAPDSMQSDAPGVKLKDLSERSSDSASPLVALKVLQARWQLWKLRRVSRVREKQREKERVRAGRAAGVVGSMGGGGTGFWGGDEDDFAKDNYGWVNHILFFLCLVGLAGVLPFILGRFVEIETFTEHSLSKWDEVPVYGDLSEVDIANAQTLLSTFEAFVQTWTLAPFASLTTLPQAVAFEYDALDSTVYFAEAYPSQLRTDGVALGTYNFSQSAPLGEGVRQPQLNATFLENGGRAGGGKVADGETEADGALVQFPKWGIRIECELLPDMNKYFVPVSTDGYTYIFVPNFLLDELFTRLSIPPPVLAPANLTRFLSQNDTLPAGVDPNEIVFIRSFYQNGVAHSFGSGPAGPGDGSGFYEIELHLVRLNQAYTPEGSFPVVGPVLTSPTDPPGSRIGYDAAVCIEVYEPWIVEAFNSTSGVLPLTTRIIGRGNEMFDESVDSMASGVPGAKRKRKITGVERVLTSEGKGNVFAIAHDNSVNQMVKDNGRDQDYVPSPTVVSWTDGSGPQGYTKLNPGRVAVARALADSTNVLPYLAGTKQLVARRFQDRSLATARLIPWFTVAALGAVLLIGLAAGFTVPRLPLGVPRRAFDLMSWLAVLHGDGMVGHVPEKRRKPGTLGEDGTPTLEEKMPLSEVENRMGAMRVRYVV